MEIICCALKQELEPLKKHFSDNVEFVNIGIKANKLDFLKSLGENDHVTNIGVCAGRNVGEIHLCNKIIGSKTYYPDIFFDSGIPQATIKTIDYIASQETVKKEPDLLFDQEASILFEAASSYIAPHQISFLKITSDCGVTDFKTLSNMIGQFITDQIKPIEKFITESKDFMDNIANKKRPISISKYSQLLKCSTSMEYRLKQQLNYAQILKCDYEDFFNRLNERYSFPLKSKKDATKILDEFDKYLISQ